MIVLNKPGILLFPLTTTQPSGIIPGTYWLLPVMPVLYGQPCTYPSSLDPRFLVLRPGHFSDEKRYLNDVP